jgi:hypothetical protein
VKWKARGNHKYNMNQNVQKISVERHNEGPRVAVVTHGGDRTWDDMMNEGKKNEQWVRKLVGPIPAFDP